MSSNGSSKSSAPTRTPTPESESLLPSALYARVSTKEQEDGYSVPSQFDRMQLKAAKLGWKGVFEKTDVASGGNLERKGLDEIRQLAKAGKIKGLLVYDLDRLSRSLRDGLNLIEEFRECGVTVQSCKQRLDDDDAEDEAAESFWDAQKERKKIRERTMRGKQKKAELGGYPHTCLPYGLVYVHGEKITGQKYRASTAAFVEAEVPIVREVFEHRARGCAYWNIAARLNLRKVPTRRGTRWGLQTVKQMLHNESYLGVLVWHRGRPDEQRFGCPQIIPRELWDAAHAQDGTVAVIKVGRPSKRIYLLVGKLFCGWCERKNKRTGKTAPSRWTTIRNSGYPQYRCGNFEYAPYRNFCPGSTVTTKILDAAVWDTIVAALKRPEKLWPDIEKFINRQNEQTGTDKKIQERLKAVRTANAQLEIAGDGELPDHVRAAARKKAVAANRLAEQLASEIAESGRMIVLPAKSEFLKQCSEIAERIRLVTTFETKRAIVETLVDRIIYRDREAVIHCRVGCAESAQQNGNNGIDPAYHFAKAIPFILRVKLAA